MEKPKKFTVFLGRLKKVFGVGVYLVIISALFEALTFSIQPYLSFPITVPQRWKIALTILCMLCALSGIIWFNKTLRLINVHFAGGENKLVTHGPYNYVRHPLYSILTLSLPPIAILWNEDILFILPWMLIILFAKNMVKIEERGLLETFGERYLQYKACVPSLFPYRGNAGKKFRKQLEEEKQNNMVTIIPYQERWGTEFQAIARGLRQALGDLALRIDHIGSTSVPGLAAKDIIDIQITVPELRDEIRQAITSLGYVHRPRITGDHCPATANPDKNEWRKWYFREADGARRVHIHVRLPGRLNQRYPLLFRDYLRAHPAMASSYAELKRRLATHLADFTMYPEVKDPAVDLIYFPAEEWAKQTGWQQGSSDA